MVPVVLLGVGDWIWIGEEITYIGSCSVWKKSDMAGLVDYSCDSKLGDAGQSR